MLCPLITWVCRTHQISPSNIRLGTPRPTFAEICDWTSCKTWEAPPRKTRHMLRGSMASTQKPTNNLERQRLQMYPPLLAPTWSHRSQSSRVFQGKHPQVRAPKNRGAFCWAWRPRSCEASVWLFLQGRVHCSDGELRFTILMLRPSRHRPSASPHVCVCVCFFLRGTPFCRWS